MIQCLRGMGAKSYMDGRKEQEVLDKRDWHRDKRLVFMEGSMAGFLGCSYPGTPKAAWSVLWALEGLG